MSILFLQVDKVKTAIPTISNKLFLINVDAEFSELLLLGKSVLSMLICRVFGIHEVIMKSSYDMLKSTLLTLLHTYSD